VSSKPSVFTWATDALYPAGSESFSGTDTKTEPSSGKKAEGWEPKERPAAQAMNWALNTLGLWTQYLSDGALAGNHTIDGDLTVTGDLDVTGNATAEDIRFRATRVRRIPASAAKSQDGVGAWTFGASGPHEWQPQATLVSLYYPIVVENVEVIDYVKLYLIKGTNASTTINVALYRINETSGSQVPIATGACAENATGYTSITLNDPDDFPHAVVPACAYFLACESSTAGALDRLLGVEIGYHRP
jgi:hypothetical protein